MQCDTEENRVLSIPLADGHLVEAVSYGSGSLCLSVQVGCAMGCPFCASGQKGLFRNLAAGELVQQLTADSAPPASPSPASASLLPTRRSRNSSSTSSGVGYLFPSPAPATPLPDSPNSAACPTTA